MEFKKQTPAHDYPLFGEWVKESLKRVHVSQRFIESTGKLSHGGIRNVMLGEK